MGGEDHLIGFMAEDRKCSGCGDNYTVNAYRNELGSLCGKCVIKAKMKKRGIKESEQITLVKCPYCEVNMIPQDYNYLCLKCGRMFVYDTE